MSKSLLRGTAVGTVSALALAIAGQASAVSFDAGDTKVTVGGYVKGDLVFESDNKSGSAAFAFSGIKTSDADKAAQPSNHFLASGQQSRLKVATSTPTEDGKSVNTVLEGDFWGGTLRLRHAWATYDGIGVGQTWSNFMPLISLAPTLDFGGPAGYIFNRQTQLRYTSGGLSVALEDSASKISGGTGHETMPDITARYSGKTGNLSYNASGVITFLEVDDGTTDDSATGYGLSLGMSSKMDSGLKVGGNIGYFDGANRYLNRRHTAGAVVVNGELETIGEVGATVWVDVPVGEKTSMGLVYGYDKIDDEGQGGAEQFTTIHANLRYKPVKAVTLGVEVQYAEREDFSGADGDTTRLQFSGQVNF